MRLLAVKPLLYVIAALLAAVMLLATRSCVQSAGARTHAAQQKAADELVARVRTERDAWKRQAETNACLLYTSPSPRDGLLSRMPSSA